MRGAVGIDMFFSLAFTNRQKTLAHLLLISRHAIPRLHDTDGISGILSKGLTAEAQTVDSN